MWREIGMIVNLSRAAVVPWQLEKEKSGDIVTGEIIRREKWRQELSWLIQGRKENDGSAPFIFITIAELFADRTLALGMRFAFHVQLPFIKKKQAACSTNHTGI